MTKNRFKTKQYKERVQPAARRSLGMLEKHKDYVQRARDFHKKQRQLKRLERKAENRNPDEFRFAMENTRLDTATGHTKQLASRREREYAAQHGADEQRLLQTQDIAYLEMRRAVDLHKAARLRAELHGLDEPVRGTHTLFVDDDDAARIRAAPAPAAAAAAVAGMLDTLPELLETRARPSLAALRSGTSVVVGGGASGVLSAAALANQRTRYLELRAREERAARLGALSHELELQRALAAEPRGGCSRKLVGSGGRVAVVWRQERKK